VEKDGFLPLTRCVGNGTGSHIVDIIIPAPGVCRPGGLGYRIVNNSFVSEGGAAHSGLGCPNTFSDLEHVTF